MASSVLPAILAVLIIVLAYYIYATRNVFRCGACPLGTGGPGTGQICYRKKADPAARCAQCVEPSDCPSPGPTACINNACICRDRGDCPAEAPNCCGGACAECCDDTQCRIDHACYRGRCEPVPRCIVSPDCGPDGLCGMAGVCLEASLETCEDGDWVCGPRSYCNRGQCYVPMVPKG
jgi:hypothetical protein